VTHRYPANGSFDVTLTVSTTSGARTTQTAAVDIDAPVQHASYLAQRATHGTGSKETVGLPHQAHHGDTVVLMLAYDATHASIARPKGWSLARHRVHDDLGTAIYTKQIGKHTKRSVAVRFSHRTHVAAVAAAYSHVSALPIERAKSAADAATTVHPAPTLHGLTTGSLGVGFWSERQSQQPNWALPKGTKHRVYAKTGGIGLAVGQAAVTLSGTCSPGAAHTQRKVAAIRWTVALSPALK
jgi:hypothetical protein